MIFSYERADFVISLLVVKYFVSTSWYIGTHFKMHMNNFAIARTCTKYKPVDKHAETKLLL